MLPAASRGGNAHDPLLAHVTPPLFASYGSRVSGLLGQVASYAPVQMLPSEEELDEIALRCGLYGSFAY